MASAAGYQCKMCRKLKPYNQFSNKQHETLRRECQQWRAARRAPSSRDPQQLANSGEYMSCKGCTPGPVQELYCIGCDQDLPLSDFAKAQRRNPDMAKCQKCMWKQVNTEPGESSAPTKASLGLVEYSDSEDSSDSNPYEEDESGYRLGSSFNKLSVNNENDMSSQAPAGWVDQERAGPSDTGRRGQSSFPTTSASSRQGPGQSARGSQRTGPGFRSGSSGGSQRRGPSSIAPSDATSQGTAKQSRGGWAKPPRGPSNVAETMPDIDDDSDDDWGMPTAGPTRLDEDDLP